VPHLRREDREVTDTGEIDALLLAGRFVTVAMARGDEPYLVTLSYGYDPREKALYVHASHEGQKAEWLRANPVICATVVDDRGYRDGQCEHEYASVVLRGTMTFVQDPEERRHGMRVLIGQLESDPEPVYEKHGLDRDAVYGRMAVMKVEIETITAKKGS
jgi:nitroimidazol reductase NimA-like FMN-containing flavoprotein (pyridoxamine 5'-phosphate oxidase superfamily)